MIYSTESNFEKDIKAKRVTLVDFFATWCAPCRMLGDELAQIDNGEFGICKVDIDKAEALAIKYEVDAVPTMYIFVNGTPVERLQGFMPASELKLAIEKYL